MELRFLGNSDVKITPVIIGTWQAGKSGWPGIDDAEITRAIRAAFDEGITTFDTAEEYGWGYSEKILGSALHDVRDQVIFATKVHPKNLEHDQLIKSCHQSLKNLKTDYLDLYQVHWPSGSWGTKEVPIEETMVAMNELKRQGKIRAIGVSNFSVTQLQEAMKFGQIDSLQSPLSLFWRQVEKEHIPFCIEKDISFLAYSPLSQGILAGKFQQGHKFAKKDHRKRNRLFQPENFKRVQRALKKLEPIAKRNGISMAQMAMAWVIIGHANTYPIAGARNIEQAVENAKAVSVNLTPKDLSEIEVVSLIVTSHLDDNPIIWKI